MTNTREESKKHDQQAGETTNDAATLGARIRGIREVRGKSIEEVARAAGIKPAFLQVVEEGGVDPTLTTLDKIADALEVPVTAIFIDFSPEAIVAGVDVERAPDDIKEAIRAILKHVWGRA